MDKKTKKSIVDKSKNSKNETFDKFAELFLTVKEEQNKDGKNKKEGEGESK